VSFFAASALAVANGMIKKAAQSSPSPKMTGPMSHFKAQIMEHFST
tara:strand:+ start:545 stop:682 length:138 start_codon:yes stop_codon:yes gene_type:complete